MAQSENLYENLKHADLPTIRIAIRSDAYIGHTAGLAARFLQANLVIMPKKYASDFLRFCECNPKPCPLVGVSATGNPKMFMLGEDIDIRTDVPAYNLYRNGQLTKSTTNITDLWADDSVAFALGCSYTFEHALQQAGISLWHIAENKVVPMFLTNIETASVGSFSGKMVVSMRCIPNNKLDMVSEISARFPFAHGAPIHVGEPGKIGIADLNKPDWGDAAPLKSGQTPVFWACGVTPQVIIQKVNIPLCITHKPGHMLITDIIDASKIPKTHLIT